MPESNPSPQQGFGNWKQWLRTQYIRIKSLQGEPHYIAMGMAVGVFVAFTPTIPFHTILAVSLAFVCRGSKPAALLGSWLSNPLTIPAFYYGSYRLGMILLGRHISTSILNGDIHGLLKMGWDVAVAMISGGVMLGIVPAVTAYFLTLKLVHRIRRSRMAGSRDAHPSDPAPDGPRNTEKPLQQRPVDRNN